MKKTAIMAFVLVLLCSGMAYAVPIFNYDTGHWYDTVSGSTWLEAEQAAVALGGHLVTINDQAEQDWLGTTYSGNSSVFIGMNDIENEGVWVWISGEPVTYTNWNAGEPNNHLGNEDFAVMYSWHPDYTWNDINLPPAYPNLTLGIAEWSGPAPPAIPEPTTMLLLGTGLLGLAGIRRRRK